MTTLSAGVLPKFRSLMAKPPPSLLKGVSRGEWKTDPGLLFRPRLVLPGDRERSLG